MFEKIKDEYDKNYNDELKNAGVFWAFSNNQFDENKTYKDAPDNEYISVGAGGYIHKSDKHKFENFVKVIAPKLKADFVSKIEMNDLIKYELINHECYYTGDLSEVVEIVHSYYDIPIDDIYDKVKNVYMNKDNKNIDDFDNSHIGI